MRYVVNLEYAGEHYHGWQKQKNIPNTIQQHVETAISSVANQEISVTCAGRTDKGVHATNQVIHFDSDADRSDHAWLCGINSNLPHDIAVNWLKPISEDFHARFSASARRYNYWIYNNPTRSAILHDKITWHLQPLQLEAMQQAAKYLIGEHDFSAFRAASCQANSAMRNVTEIIISQQDKLIKIDIAANAFLHHMVRNIVGSLFEVGEGKQTPQWLAEVLATKDRNQAGITAPADGLYLVDISYPDEYKISMQQGICYNMLNS